MTVEEELINYRELIQLETSLDGIRSQLEAAGRNMVNFGMSLLMTVDGATDESLLLLQKKIGTIKDAAPDLYPEDAEAFCIYLVSLMSIMSEYRYYFTKQVDA